jgi:hypothetical protein
MLVKIADAHTWSKMTYNNAISALRRAIAFGYQDHREARSRCEFTKRTHWKERSAAD